MCPSLHIKTTSIMITPDKTIHIATAGSARASTWTNETTSWDNFALRFETPIITAETAQQYAQGDKAFRDRCKDVGGFVGGYLHDGKRRKANIRYRSLLCLDLDYATADTLPYLDDALQGYAYVLYSTHSHTSESPRYRLVMPILGARLTPEHYEPLSRAVGARLALDEWLDDSTHQPERLMYWASVARGADYVYRRGDGRWIDPDEYDLGGLFETSGASDADATQEATSETLAPRKAENAEASTIQGVGTGRRAVAKLSDPRRKDGIVGAFCTCYSISGAIARFLPHIYRYEGRDHGHDRYTYLGGTTTKGAIAYDDLHLYSHHGSDPVHARACNAFDLVRLHLYGHLDAGTSDRVRMDRRPSYKAIEELVMADNAVEATLRERATADFSLNDETATRPATDAKTTIGDETRHTDESDDDWLVKLSLTSKGNIASSSDNILTILRHDKRLAGRFYRDTFAQRIYIERPLPWRERVPAEWNDDDSSALRVYLESTYRIASSNKVSDALATYILSSDRHPIREYLDTCAWDGTPRLDTLFVDYLGAPDTPLVRAMTRKALTAAVARIIAPGCKYDQITVLAGREGIGKSTLLRRLGGRWYTDSFVTVEGKEAMDQLAGAWIIEIAELTALNKVEMTAVKAFVSKQEDSYRAAYARMKTTRPRQCVFFGTTNERDFLRDENGNRRFWVVPVGTTTATHSPWSLDDETLRQVWGEAVYRYYEGESLYLVSAERDALRALQDVYTEEDPRLGVIAEYLDKPIPMDYYQWDATRRRNYIQGVEGSIYPGTPMTQRTYVCVAEVLFEAFIRPVEPNRRASLEIARLLGKVPGWTRAESRRYDSAYGRQRTYERVGRVGQTMGQSGTDS